MIYKYHYENHVLTLPTLPTLPTRPTPICYSQIRNESLILQLQLQLLFQLQILSIAIDVTNEGVFHSPEVLSNVLDEKK